MTRFGFGDKTGETEKGGLAQYENGHVEVSGQALKSAIEQNPTLPPMAAVGLQMVAEGDAEEQAREVLQSDETGDGDD